MKPPPSGVGRLKAMAAGSAWLRRLPTAAASAPTARLPAVALAEAGRITSCSPSTSPARSAGSRSPARTAPSASGRSCRPSRTTTGWTASSAAPSPRPCSASAAPARTPSPCDSASGIRRQTSGGHDHRRSIARTQELAAYGRSTRPRLPLVRLHALPRHLHPPDLGRSHPPPSRMPLLRQADDDLGEARRVSVFTSRSEGCRIIGAVVRLARTRRAKGAGDD